MLLTSLVKITYIQLRCERITRFSIHGITTKREISRLNWAVAVAVDDDNDNHKMPSYDFFHIIKLLAMQFARIPNRVRERCAFVSRLYRVHC